MLVQQLSSFSFLNLISYFHDFIFAEALVVFRGMDEESHSQQLLRQLCYLWRQQTFCDVLLRVDNTLFHAHRLVLSAASGYFQVSHHLAYTCADYNI